MSKNGIKIAIIDWIDSSSRDEWHDTDIILEPFVITSVGILVEKTQDYVTICRSRTETDVHDGVLCVPRSAIEKIKILRI